MALITLDDLKQAPVSAIDTQPAVVNANVADQTTQAVIPDVKQTTPAPVVPAIQQKQMTGGIDNEATNTKVTSTDTSGVQDQTLQMLKAMKDQGLTYSQAFDKYYPKPTANTASEDLIRKQQKTALFADALRLVTDTVGAAKGATVYQRDQTKPYAALQNRLMQEHALFANNMADWQSKGVDSAMKGVSLSNDLYKANLQNAPKTTIENNQWNRKKFEQEQQALKDKQANDNKQKELDRKNHITTANIAHAGSGANDPKVTQLVFADNNGVAVVPNHKYEGLMSAAYQAMLTDPNYKGKIDSREIEAITNDYSFEGKKAKVREYVQQHAHESPAAQEIIKGNSDRYTRNNVAAPAQTNNWDSSPLNALKTIPGFSGGHKKKVEGF